MDFLNLFWYNMFSFGGDTMDFNNLKIGDKLEIHCYKHNGHLHRQWDEAVLLDIQDDYMVFGNNKTIVIDSDGKVWNTKEPAIMFFSGIDGLIL